MRAKEVHTEMDSIERGIVQLISQHKIRKLVMGAAADKFYSKYEHNDFSIDFPYNLFTMLFIF